MNLDATLTLERAARREWPVVIAGAGPAGSFLARDLARAGVEVLLVDRAVFPRWKVCGCCLNGTALSVLATAGLGQLTARLGAVPLSRVRLGAGSRWADLRLPAGAALSREALDAGLLHAALEAGVQFLPGSSARLLPVTPSPSLLGGEGEGVRGCRRLRLRTDQEEQILAARVVIAADGLGGQVLAGEPGHSVEAVPGSRIGAGAVADTGPDWFSPGTIYMACAAGGYVGLVRLEDGRLDLAAALDPTLVRQTGGLHGAVAAVLGTINWPGCAELSNLPWRGTPALSRQAITPGGERYFVVGDAAGYVEPFTGEGMAWAFLSAAALTPLVVRAVNGWQRSLVVEWRARLRELLARRRLLCRLLTQLLRRPLLTSALVRVVGWWPGLARPVIATLNRPVRGSERRAAISSVSL